MKRPKTSFRRIDNGNSIYKLYKTVDLFKNLTKSSDVSLSRSRNKPSIHFWYFALVVVSENRVDETSWLITMDHRLPTMTSSKVI